MCIIKEDFEGERGLVNYANDAERRVHISQLLVCLKDLLGRVVFRHAIVEGKY